jgi:HK97 family phage prohead protease
MATETDNAPGAGVSVPPPRENLVRALAETPVLERAEGEAMPTMTGHFAVFDQWTEINSVYEGRFLERIAPNAMDKTIAESRDSMRVLFNHGTDPQIANKVLGPITSLTTDAIGASYEVPLFDTSYNRDLIPGLQAGQYGASFRFAVMQEEFDSKPKRSDYNPTGLPERTITEAKVREFGPVTFPAYAGATAGLRSMTDEFLFGKFVDDPDRLREILELLAARSVEPAPSGAATPDNEEAKEFAEHFVATNATANKEPEPSAATTRPKRSNPAPLYPSTREEKPKWLL